MIVLIDNYDSFSYNVYQLVGSIRPDTVVVRNDAVTVESLLALAPDAIVLSPGPGRPDKAGICEALVSALANPLAPQIPVLGICLGHQAICEALGATVCYARNLMHGKVSRISLDTDSKIFYGLPEYIDAARYHSLAIEEASLPATLRVVGRADDGEVMAVEGIQRPFYGLQFHPESVMTAEGPAIVANFLAQVGNTS